MKKVLKKFGAPSRRRASAASVPWRLRRTSLLGDLLWLGGRDRLGEGEIIPSEMVLCWERAWLDGRVLYVVAGIGVSDLPFFKLPTMCVARLEPETENDK